MNSSKLFQALSKLVPNEKKESTLRAFKQDPLVWSDFSSQGTIDQLTQDWPGLEYALTPATLALFRLDPALLPNENSEINPSVELLERSLLAYEDYLHAPTALTQLSQAAALALALYKKAEQKPEWPRLLREIVNEQKIETSDELLHLWATPFSLITGWLEDPQAFLQALLQIQQPEFGLEMLSHAILCQPGDEADHTRLFKGVLAFAPLSAQVESVQRLANRGGASLTKQVAEALFERHLVKEAETSSISEIWKSSEKSLAAANTDRQLAALAQFAGKYAEAERLLKNAEQGYAAELAGLLIQHSALNRENGKPEADLVEQVPQLVRDDPTIQNELAMLGAQDAAETDDSAAPLAALLNADSIFKAGNEPLAKQIALESSRELWSQPEAALPSFESARALNWSPRRLLDQLIEFGLWTEARTLLNSLLRTAPADLALYLQSLKVAESMRNSSDRVTALESLSLFDPENQTWARQLAEGYADASNWEAAFDSYDTLISHFNSAKAEDWLGYAQSALKVGNAPVALDYAQKVLAAEPENGQALAILGFAHHKQGDAEKAMDCLNRSVSLAPDSVEPWLLMAELHREKGDVRQSIQVLQTAKSTFPGDKKVRLELAKQLLENGQATDALSTLKESAESNPTDLDISLLMIWAEKSLALPECAELIEKTYHAFPTSPEAIYEFANLQLSQGDRAVAADLLEPILDTAAANSSDWQLAYADAVLGEDYRNIHQTSLPQNAKVQRAKAILNQTLLAEPENIYAKLLAAEASIKEGQAAKAFEFLTNLLKEASTENSNWFDRVKAGLAWAATFLQKFEVALGGIQNIVESHPEWAAASETLAEVSQATGDISTAVDQANQVLEVAPDVVQSAEWFANFMSNLGKKDEAEASLEKLAKTHAEKLPLLVKLAEMKLQGNQYEEAQAIAASIKHSLPKSKSDAEVLRAAKVFAQTGDQQAVTDALKFRLTNAKVPTAVALADLAGYQREAGDLAVALKTLREGESKLGKQRWLQLLQAETQHANGETAEAYDLLHTLPETNDSRPDAKELSFLPINWQSMLDEDPSIEGLEQDLAFESGDYTQALTLANEGMNRVTDIEADYALGSRAEALRWLDSDASDETIYVDPWTAVQVSEILMDADQLQKAGEVLMQALDRFPEEHALKLSASRQAALSGDWPTAEALFAQEFPAISDRTPLASAQAVCLARNLVKAAMATEHWTAAESWSKRFSAQQPKNQSAQMLRLQTAVKALEFSALNRDLGIEKHILPAQKCEEVKAELAALIANLEAIKTAEAEHWCARGKVVLDPNQTNIRRLAMITPEADDIAAMMAALKNSGQVGTALQLGKKHENEPGVLIAEADCLKTDDPHKAFEALEKALKLKNVSPSAYALGAHLNMEQKEYYSAINQIEEALEYWPEEAGWQEYAAAAWQAVGDVQNSTAHLEKALQLTPDATALQLKLGQNYLQSKDLEKAIDNLSSVTKSAVNQPDGWEALAEAYYLSGQTEEALSAAQRAMDVNAFTVKPYLLSAQINLDQGNSAKALELSQKALQQDEKNPEAMIVLAKAYLASGNKLQALHSLEKVPQARNVSIAQLIEHARLVKEINGAANAKGMLELLAERYPDNLDVINMLAESQLANGDKASAEKSAQHSLKLQESQPRMQRFLGKLEFESGHLDQAIYHYSQSVALDPADSEAYLELSKVYEQQRDYSSALDTLNKALELKPDDLSAVLAAANLMRSAKDYGKAEAYLRRAAEIAPNDLNVRRQLGAVIALNLVESSQEASSHI